MSVELPVPKAEVPASTFEVRTTASAAMTDCKQQIRDRLTVVSQIADGSIVPEISFVNARRNWPNLWKATTRDWLSLYHRIRELGLQRMRGQRLSTDALIHLAERSIERAT